MNVKNLLLTVAALLAGACDSGTDPLPPATIVLSADAITLRVGEEQTLTADYDDPTGQRTPVVTWKSTNSSVATVNMGLVRAVGPGDAKIIVAASGAADTAQVTVLPPIATACGATGVELAAGEVRTLTSQAAAFICLNGGSGREYTFVMTNVDPQPALVQAAATGTTGVTGPPSPDRIPRLGSLAARRASRSLAATFDAQLRERGRILMRNRGPAARARGARRTLLRQISPDVQLGDSITLKVDTAFCEAPGEQRRARVVAIGEHSIIVEDYANPKGGLTDAQYKQVATTFDNEIWPSDTENFGEPSDIDENGKVILFYTAAVNELTPDDPEGEGFVGGYFFPGDIFPVSDCASSNEAEIFYLLAPDTAGEINNNIFRSEDVISQTEGTVAHEFEHLINASRRLYVNNASEFEEPFLDEGLAHIAEELLFYRVSGLQPRQNINLNRIRSTQQIFDAFVTFEISNFGRVDTYVKKPESNGPFEPDDDLETRGAIWQFLRYAVDRKNGEDRVYWRALVNSKVGGLTNLRNALAIESDDWLRDFAIAQYTDDAVAGVDARYTQPSWNYRNILPAIQPQGDPQIFPLKTRSLTNGAKLNFELSDQGGSAYLRAAVPAGGVGGVRLTQDGNALPGTVRVTVIRTK